MKSSTHGTPSEVMAAVTEAMTELEAIFAGASALLSATKPRSPQLVSQLLQLGRSQTQFWQNEFDIVREEFKGQENQS
jgi:hypothetical protein